ncbi:MAG: hypothetical protein WCB85_09585 [Candidatus Dormiibacterota bacterium]
MQGRFHPNPNLSPASPLDRLLGLTVGIGLLVVAAAAVVAALIAWILLMALAAGWAAQAGPILAILLVVAMAGFALAVCAAGLWSLLQIGSVRRALGLR